MCHGGKRTGHGSPLTATCPTPHAKAAAMPFTSAILAVHANAWLSGDLEAVGPDFHERHPAFGFYRAIEFGDGLTLFGWLEEQRDRGTERVWLHRPTGRALLERLPEDAAAAFAASLRVGLLTTGAMPAELWVSQMELVDGPPPVTAGNGFQGPSGYSYSNPRRWRLVFSPFAAAEEAPAVVTVPEAAAVLGAALQRIEAFAATIADLDGWRRRFADARAHLDSGGDAFELQPELFPANALSTAALRLFAASEHASVFGGMGSWNDLWIEDQAQQAEYEVVSTALARAIDTAYFAIINGDSGIRDRS
jgi:hypothetical protein